MVYSYYPGCTLKNKASKLDYFARACAEKLGFTLEELPEWQCCGGVFPMAKDEVATKLASVRAMAAARDSGRELITLCSACYNVFKQVNNAIVEDEDFHNRVNNYLRTDEVQYDGETKVVHYLEVIRDVIGFDKLAEIVKQSSPDGVSRLKGKKIGAYYGCLMLRPGKIMQFDDPENPKILEDFIRALGAEPVVYAQRNECCGAYTMFEDESIPEKRSAAILGNAQEQGAECLVTSCPLCRYNLIKNAEGKDGMPSVVYFTELLAQALGIEASEEKLKEAYYG